MKKIIIAILSVLMIFGLVACEEKEKNTYIVTFVQNGCENVIRTVKEGEDVINIPSPKDKVGYTIEWDKTDLTKIDCNMTVNAVESPNTYTITYDANGGSVSNQTQSVVYGENYTLLTPTKDGYDFVCWTNSENNILINGKWEIAENITLKAKWQEVAVEQCVVTFIFHDGKSVTKTVQKGETLTDVPQNSVVTGYDVCWDKTTFENVTENQTVYEQKTGKTYTVTFNANGGSVGEPQKTVTFGEAYTLPTPTFSDHTFTGWKYNNTTYTSGNSWAIADNVELVATWTNGTYTITFDYGKSASWVSGKNLPKTINVVYGESLNGKLPTITIDKDDDYIFKGWKIKGSSEKFTDTTFNFTSDIELVAVWSRQWTDNY